MIDDYERLRFKSSELLDYTYPENLSKWKLDIQDRINIDSPVIDSFNSGCVYYFNDGWIQHLFILDLLKRPITETIPVAFLATSEEQRNELNEALLSLLLDKYSDEIVIYSFLSAKQVISKKLRARRFCELEDELRELSFKGYRVVVLSKFEELPYLDAESREKKYRNHLDALNILATELGLIILIIYEKYQMEMDDNTLFRITPKPRKYLPPCDVNVKNNSGRNASYRFLCSPKLQSEGIGSFRFEMKMIENC